MTIQTAVLIETLVDLGKVNGHPAISFQPKIMQQQPLQRKESLYTRKKVRLLMNIGSTPITFLIGSDSPNMILDDGGDATGLLILGSKAEKDLSVLDNPGNEEEIALFKSIKCKLQSDGNFYSRIKSNIIGVTEETTTGVARLYQLQSKMHYLFLL